ncbi:hypothetical protein EASAB2608_00097 [Streptomyces sp. EAS-AB2608]|nr:hypothetical protein EASAB2608_00097 [Streptomyces sp. EAS-AB2608]CUW32688.1 hypothetical protein TUE45_pSRTUE45c_0056 [Streptomyces reticuli]
MPRGGLAQAGTARPSRRGGLLSVGGATPDARCSAFRLPPAGSRPAAAPRQGAEPSVPTDRVLTEDLTRGFSHGAAPP